jgi:hypothetical protein
MAAAARLCGAPSQKHSTELFMGFLYGKYFLWAEAQNWGSSVEYEYVEKDSTYSAVRRVWIKATVIPDGRLGSQVLIDGKKPLGGLPITIDVRAGVPQDYDEMRPEQQQQPDKDATAGIKKTIGQCTYLEAFKDEETRETFEETLSAELIVEDSVMNDLWSAVPDA